MDSSTVSKIRRRSSAMSLVASAVILGWDGDASPTQSRHEGGLCVCARARAYVLRSLCAKFGREVWAPEFLFFQGGAGDMPEVSPQYLRSSASASYLGFAVAYIATLRMNSVTRLR